MTAVAIVRVAAGLTRLERAVAREVVATDKTNGALVHLRAVGAKGKVVTLFTSRTRAAVGGWAAALAEAGAVLVVIPYVAGTGVVLAVAPAAALAVGRVGHAGPAEAAVGATRTTQTANKENER